MADQRVDPTLYALAITLVEGGLRDQQGWNGVPELTPKARNAVAKQIVEQNGVLDPVKNRKDAVDEVKKNPKWEYCGLGFMGRLRVRFKKMMGR